MLSSLIGKPIGLDPLFVRVSRAAAENYEALHGEPPHPEMNAWSLIENYSVPVQRTRIPKAGSKRAGE